MRIDSYPQFQALYGNVSLQRCTVCNAIVNQNDTMAHRRWHRVLAQAASK